MNPGLLLPRIAALLSLACVAVNSLGAESTQPTYRPHVSERIALVGNSLAERMNLFGEFETLLHTRFPHLKLVVRNFGRPADEVDKQQRPNDYTKIDDPLKVFGAETFICFFGANESYEGPAGVEKFKADYEKWMDGYAQKYGPEGNKARFVLVSPIAFESTGNPLQPDGNKENENLKLYSEAVAAVAKKRNLPFVDLYAPTATAFGKEAGAQFTINGLHVNEAGDRMVGELMDRSLFGGSANSPVLTGETSERLKTAVQEKSWVHSQDYRMLNGWYVYGGRRTWDTETFPLEYKKIRGMAALRDGRVWDIAAGKPVSGEPDDSTTGELIVPKTRFGTPRQEYSEPKELRYLSGEESVKAMKPADGFEVKLFASEKEFPEIAKPVQVNFDSKGRLWVSTMPSYPQWRPGDPKPNDRLLILEDTDKDGRADKVKVFYDQLHCPTGFEFWNGGVLVVSQPRMLFLKDTDGDDKADQVTELSDGWASDDTHHTIGAFEFSHGGVLHMLEGVSMSTAVETPWGPFRNENTPGAYKFDPLTLKLSRFMTPGYGNPWCYVFDKWGQGFAGDGTTAQQHWDTPLSTSPKANRKGLNAVFDTQGMRPVIGSEFLLSRHLPDDVQGQFVYACVINMNGITRFNIKDDGAGFTGKRTDDLLSSTDRNFRPGDPQIGPDGALWFIDWHNPLIGHMQYSQRDPNRDKVHGRVYRLTAKGRPLLTPVLQHGKSVPELLAQLSEYEPRTRYRVRRELWTRPKNEVLNGIKEVASRDDLSDALLCELMWVQQGFHAIDRALLKRVLESKTFEARAAAVHALAEEWAYLDNPMELARATAKDPHPRVRLETARALSYVETRESVNLLLDIAAQPVDYWMDYTLQHALSALEPIWKDALAEGTLAKNNQEGQDYLKAYVSGRPQLGSAQRFLKELLNNSDLPAADREKAYAAVANARGKAPLGKAIFERICISCHKVGSVGAEFGPNLTDVGKRMKRTDLIESVIHPNEKVDPKYLMVNITTRGGNEVSGIITKETDKEVTVLVGVSQVEVIPKDQIAERESTKVSNMPEGLGQTMSAEEFVDLIEYMASLR